MSEHNSQLEADLSSMLEKDQLYLVYQPQYTISDSSLIGLEVLVRWKHPTLGEIPPSRFIPLAEQKGYIKELGLWVLKTACRHYKKWESEQLINEDFKLAINVSPLQLNKEDFIDSLKDIFLQNSMIPSNIELEITETNFMDNEQELVEVLQELKKMGVRIAMDDFGVGHSSLSRLKDLPFDALKLDKSFIDDLVNDENSGKIVRAVIALGRDLGMEVISEGIETEKQLEILRKYRCHVAQGFYFEKSNFEFNEMTDFLKRHIYF